MLCYMSHSSTNSVIGIEALKSFYNPPSVPMMGYGLYLMLCGVLFFSRSRFSFNFLSPRVTSEPRVDTIVNSSASVAYTLSVRVSIDRVPTADIIRLLSRHRLCGGRGAIDQYMESGGGSTVVARVPQ